MPTQLRLLWRLHRWEGTFFIGGVLLLSAAMAIVAWQLEVSRDTLLACYEQPAGSLSAECRSAIAWGNTLTGAIGILGAVATDQAYNRYPGSFDPMTGEGGPSGMTSVWKIVPPEAFDLYVAREIGVLALAFLVAGLATLGLVRRRRPQ